MSVESSASAENAQLRIADSREGHAGAVDINHLQRAPSEVSLASDPQLLAVRTAETPKPRRLHKNPLRVFGVVTHDEKGRATYASKRYEGVTFEFYSTNTQSGHRQHIFCAKCFGICNTYKDALQACGLVRRSAIVLNGQYVDVDPDDVGTNEGHVCRQPQLVKRLTDKAKEFASVTQNVGADVSRNRLDNVENASAPQIESDINEGSYVRTRTRSHRTSMANQASDDNTFGDIQVLTVASLTAAEKSLWCTAPDIAEGPMRGKELVGYRSKKHRRLFKFLVIGSSYLDESAFDFYCIDCWIKHETICKVTVRSDKFIIADPDLTTEGVHLCVGSELPFLQQTNTSSRRLRSVETDVCAPKAAADSAEPLPKRTRIPETDEQRITAEAEEHIVSIGNVERADDRAAKDEPSELQPVMSSPTASVDINALNPLATSTPNSVSTAKESATPNNSGTGRCSTINMDAASSGSIAGTPAQDTTTAGDGSFQMMEGNRRIVWQSRRYPGETLTFTYSKDGVNRCYYVCNACSRLCHTYRKCLEPCGVKRQNLIMEKGQFVNDPDLVGTNKGHLCMQPALEDQLKAMLSLVADVHNKATSKMQGNAHDRTLEDNRHENRHSVQGNAGTVEKPSRKRSVALMTEPSTQPNDDDGENSFGLVKFVALSELTDRQRGLIEALPLKLRSAMRGKEAVEWFDKERKVTLLFLLLAESKLVDGAWEFYCDGCYSLSKEERRVIVRDNRFLRFDPRLPEDQEHICVAPNQAARKASHSMQAKKSASIGANVSAPQSDLAPNYGNVINKPNGHVVYRSRLYDRRHIDFSRSSRKSGVKQWFPCTACYGLRTLCEARIPECISAKLFSAIVRDGQFVERDPDVCGLELKFANGTSRCVHVCLDAELQELIGGPAEPPRKQMCLSNFFDKRSFTTAKLGVGSTLPARSATPPARRSSFMTGASPSTSVSHDERDALKTSFLSSTLANGQRDPQRDVRPTLEPHVPSVEMSGGTSVSSEPRAIVLQQYSANADSDDDVKPILVKTRSRFIAFIEAEGLKEEFAEFDLEHGRSYATIEKSHIAFLKQRRLLGKYTDFMS